MQRSIPFLWGLVFILLILFLLLLDTLNLARLTAIETLSKVETTLDRLASEVIVYNIEINQAVPVQVDVPFNRTMEIPLNTVIPIDQVLSVPFQTPAGEIMLDIPVKTDFPVDMVIPVEFNETISVDTVVELNTTLPVEIDIAQTPLAGYLQQAKSDIARLRSRLDLRGEAAQVEESVAGVATAGATSADSPSTTTGASQFEVPSAQTGAGETPPSGQAPESSGTQTAVTDPMLLPEMTGIEPDLGLCASAYWPLWPGSRHTYNSRDTSYTQYVESVSGNQVLLRTLYEGRDIRSNLICYQEGLGGNFLGDMRRIAELGDLNFSNPRGMFLPLPEVMERIGTTWTQEFDVAGVVQAIQGDRLVAGNVRRGRAVATYTPTGFDSVETPSGSKDALRVEQKLELELDLNFDLGGQTIPVTERVNLTTVYWFVRDSGLVKVHWQGGTIQYAADIGGTPANQQSAIAALAEDQLVFVCVTLGDQSVQCATMGGISESDLTTPPESELEVQGFVFPASIGGDEDAGTTATATGEPPGGGGDWLDLVSYAAAVDSLGQRLSEAAEGFWEAALKFQNDQITLDEFRNAFLDFSPKVSGLVQEINRLSPPPEARGVHQKLTDGLAQCDQAVDLMEDWFDTPNSDTKEAATLLVASCVEEVTAAGEELTALKDGN